MFAFTVDDIQCAFLNMTYCRVELPVRLLQGTGFTLFSSGVFHSSAVGRQDEGEIMLMRDI